MNSYKIIYISNLVICHISKSSTICFFVLETPSVPTVTGCPSQDYQAENTTVRCTCTTGNVGKPAGRLQWFRIGSSSPLATGDYGNKTLTLSHTLQRGDHNRALFRCDVGWAADVTGATVTFKVGCECVHLFL